MAVRGQKRRVRPSQGFPKAFATAVPDPNMGEFDLIEYENPEDGISVLHAYSDEYKAMLPAVSVVPAPYEIILDRLPPDDSNKCWGTIYIWVGQLSGLVKVGYSLTPRRRLIQAQSGSGETIIFIDKIDGGRDVEHHIHQELKPYRHHGEWYHPCAEVIRWIDDAIMYGGY